MLLLATLLAGCSGGNPGAPGPSAKGASVVLISIDTLRADRLPAYGYKSVETPAIDGLRKDAILFENAYTHSPLTLPAHASLLTGLLPPEHGVRNNIGYRLEPA
ncbi:MAG: sulfatase-like hydrolase/transferase, partial [Burkholderiales bacterium]